MDGESGRHWDAAYQNGDTSRSWYQSHADVSLALIREAAPDPEAAIVDVGGGASTLVDGLLAEGYRDLTVLDISRVGLDLAAARLGPGPASDVTWVLADLLTWHPERTYDLWHDRAVLHFMTADSDLDEYRQCVMAATAPGATVVVGVFGPDGPESCSGLPVRRFDPATMAGWLGPDFLVERSVLQDHRTPTGGGQQFLWTVARRQA